MPKNLKSTIYFFEGYPMHKGDRPICAISRSLKGIDFLDQFPHHHWKLRIVKFWHDGCKEEKNEQSICRKIRKEKSDKETDAGICCSSCKSG